MPSSKDCFDKSIGKPPIFSANGNLDDLTSLIITGKSFAKVNLLIAKSPRPIGPAPFISTDWISL